MAQSIKITEMKKIEVNDKLVGKIVQEIKVCKDEGIKRIQKTVETYAIYFYPKDENGVWDLNWKNRNRDYDSKKSLKEKFPLFWDLIEETREKTLLCQG